MDPDRIDTTDDLTAGPQWRGTLHWTALLAAGWLTYELTTQPALGVLVVCAKFGWEDYATGYRLWRSDPHRGRGRACFWLYVASGLRSTVFVAFALVFCAAVLAGLEHRQGPPPALARQGGPPPAVLAALATAVIGFGLFSATSAFAFGLAYHYRVLLWLGPQARHWRRRGRHWPPYDPDDTRPNGASSLLLTVLILWTVPLLLVLLAASSAIIGAALVKEQLAAGPRPLVSTAILTLGIVGLAIGVVAIGEFLMNLTVADHPAACWGNHSDPVGPAAPTYESSSLVPLTAERGGSER